MIAKEKKTKVCLFFKYKSCVYYNYLLFPSSNHNFLVDSFFPVSQMIVPEDTHNQDHVIFPMIQTKQKKMLTNLKNNKK